MSGGPAEVSLGSRFGYGLLVATSLGGAAVVPAALRVATNGPSLPVAWLALWGGAALTLAPVAASLRIARPFSTLAWSVPLGIVFSLAPLAMFARVLKTATHHRPLGAVTFAVIALMLVLGAIAVAARLLAWAEKRKGTALGRAPQLAGIIGGVLTLPFLPSLLASGLRASVLDAGLGLVTVAVGASVAVHSGLAQRAWLLGLLVWSAAVVLGLGLGMGAAETRAVLADRAPLLLGLAGLLRP
ncbi:MAG: hypothetical protein IPI67_01335 [Myxococcales bacterium]|nr:hypothetical protein [Myxococcales bacterium]